MQNIHNQIIHPRGSYLSAGELHREENQILHSFRAIRQIQNEPTPENKRAQLSSSSLTPMIQLELFD
ncbi:MAG: hypothetical protein HYZ34_03665 [Ignavibacteriae bacterium]|nr:hypothetical protein [Ignavibacteriota bacterium]